MKVLHDITLDNQLRILVTDQGHFAALEPLCSFIGLNFSELIDSINESRFLGEKTQILGENEEIVAIHSSAIPGLLFHCFGMVMDDTFRADLEKFYATMLQKASDVAFSKVDRKASGQVSSRRIQLNGELKEVSSERERLESEVKKDSDYFENLKHSLAEMDDSNPEKTKLKHTSLKVQTRLRDNRQSLESLISKEKGLKDLASGILKNDNAVIEVLSALFPSISNAK